jgi:hypothetical protein
MNGLFSKLPSGPISASRGISTDTGVITAWSVKQTDGGLIVYLPSNIESLGDDPMSQAAIAACYVLRPKFEVSTEEVELKELDKKAQSYFSGIAWALHEGGTTMPPYRDVSGALGHGYYWACHSALEWQLKSGTWWAKGTSWHPTKGLTGKAWSKDLDATTRNVNSLLSRAAHAQSVTTNWASWFRSYESFVGREVKKSVPHQNTEIISSVEKGYLNSKHDAAIRAYNELLRKLKDPTLQDLRGLAAEIKSVGQLLTPLSTLCDTVISHRMSSVYPKSKGDRRKALKRPLKEVIKELGVAQYIFVFDPLVLGGQKPFRIENPEDLEVDELPWPLITESYNRKISSVRKGGNELLANLAESFRDETFFVREGSDE